MLLLVLDLEKVSVNDIMVLCNEIVGIDINDDWKFIVCQLIYFLYGCIVFYCDLLDDVISMLCVCEVYCLMMEKKEFIKEIMLWVVDEIYFVLEGMLFSIQLVKFQCNKKKVGLVVDEYGDIQGLVIVEDIFEEIVGDFIIFMLFILVEEVILFNDGMVIIDGSVNVCEINKVFNWYLLEDEVCIVNGIIFEVLEEILVLGICVCIEQYDIDIFDVQDNMIKQVKVMLVKLLCESVVEQCQ